MHLEGVIMALNQQELERVIRLEERIGQLQREMVTVEEEISALKKHDHDVDLTAQQNSLSVSNFERIFWALITGGIGYIIYTLQNSTGSIQ